MEGTVATEASAAEPAKPSIQEEAERFWELFDDYAPISRRRAYNILTSLPTVARNLDGTFACPHFAAVYSNGAL